MNTSTIHVNMHIIHTINILSKERLALYKVYDDSFDASIGSFGDYIELWNPKIDELAAKILNLLKEFYKDLPLELVLEELTKLGDAPSLLYDDNGHWAIGTSGYQSVTTGNEAADVESIFVVKEEEWFDTIYEALGNYLLTD